MPTIRDILRTVDTTVYDFFRETTVILNTAGKESWFQQLTTVQDGLSVLEKDFKQMESNFIILVILHTKFEKVDTLRFFILFLGILYEIDYTSVDRSLKRFSAPTAKSTRSG